VIVRALEYDGYITDPWLLLRWAGHEWGTRIECNGRMWELLDHLTVRMFVPEAKRADWLRMHAEDDITVEVTESHPEARLRGKTIDAKIKHLNDFGLRRPLRERVAWRREDGTAE
jgi:hypothetical protein